MPSTPDNKGLPPLDVDSPILDNSLNARLSKIESSIIRIELAITGSPQMGHKGIVERLNAVENKVETHDKKLVTWGAFIAGAVMLLQFVVQYVRYLTGNHN